MSRVIYEEWQDGFAIVGEEAYLPDEYDRYAKRCPSCERRFMVVSDVTGDRAAAALRYCSDGCRRVAKREQSRASMARKRAA